jgi:acyl-CoA thioester hydrolase
MSRKPEIVRADYLHLEPMPTRWMDNDVYGHINNVLYYSFFDTAINQYLITQGGLDITQSPIIGLAVESHCQYLQPLSFPAVIEVGLRVGKLGTSSVRYELAVFKQAAELAAATGYFVHVFVDRNTRRAVPIPASIRQALQRLVRPS